jgi:hypothetical protein
MPKINLFSPVTTGADAAEASQGVLDMVNGYVDMVDGLPAIKMRPGLETLYNTGTGARADLYWWEAKRILLVASGRKLFAKLSFTGNPVEITPLSGSDRFPFNAKVRFSADEYGVTMTAGTFMLWWNGDISVKAQRVSDPNAPAAISSITYLKGYTIASVPNTQTFQWALYGPTDDRNLPPPWNPLSISASASPDDIICMDSGWEELFILGRESAQSHYASGDPDIPFPALNGSVVETGTVNADTLRKIGNTWIYFTPNYQVVRVQGRTPTVISQAIEQRLRRLSYFDNSEAYVLFERFYVLTFPRDDITFVYDLNTGLWYRWGAWDAQVIKYREYKGLSAAYAKPWGKQIIGGSDGYVYTVNHDVATDAGDLIRFRLRSAHIDHGTLNRKFASEIRMRLRRGV